MNYFRNKAFLLISILSYVILIAIYVLFSVSKVTVNDMDYFGGVNKGVEELSQDVLIRKELEIDKSRILSAELQFSAYEYKNNGLPLKIFINNNELIYLSNPKWQGEWHWHQISIPYDYLKPGHNQILFTADNQLSINHSWALGIAESFYPDKSAKSKDLGNSWDYEILGADNNIDGEYVIRINTYCRVKWRNMSLWRIAKKVLSLLVYLSFIIATTKLTLQSRNSEKEALLLTILLVILISLITIFFYKISDYFLLVTLLANIFLALDIRSPYTDRSIRPLLWRDCLTEIVKGLIRLNSLKSLLYILAGAISFNLFIYQFDKEIGTLFPSSLKGLSYLLSESIIYSSLFFSILFIIFWLLVAIILRKWLRIVALDSLGITAKSFMAYLLFIPLIILHGFINAPPFYLVCLFIIVNSAFLASIFRPLTLCPKSLNILGSHGQKIILLLIVVYILYFNAILSSHYQRLHFYRGDTVDITTALYNSLKGNGPFMYSPIINTNLLGAHFYLMLIYLLPLYALFPGIKTLYIIHLMLHASVALLLFRFIREKSKNEWLSICFATAYLLYPAHHVIHLNILGFGPALLVPSLYLYAFIFLLKNKYYWYFLSLTLLMSSREDVGLTLVLMLGLYSIAFLREFKIGPLTTCYGIFWYLFATRIAIPFFRGGNYPFVSPLYAHLGDSIWGIMKHFIYCPSYFSNLLLTEENLEYVLRLLMPLGLLPLFNPFTLILGLLSYLANFLVPLNLTIRAFPTHYVGLISPAIIAAAILSLPNFIKWASRILRIWFSKNLDLKEVEGWIGTFILISAAFSTFYFSNIPYAKSFGIEAFQTNPETLKPSHHEQFARDIIGTIPVRASISSNLTFASLIDRPNYLDFRNYFESDYTFFDLLNTYPIPKEEMYGAINRLMHSDTHTVVAVKDGLILFKKIMPGEKEDNKELSKLIKLLEINKKRGIGYKY